MSSKHPLCCKRSMHSQVKLSLARCCGRRALSHDRWLLICPPAQQTLLKTTHRALALASGMPKSRPNLLCRGGHRICATAAQAVPHPTDAVGISSRHRTGVCGQDEAAGAKGMCLHCHRRHHPGTAAHIQLTHIDLMSVRQRGGNKNSRPALPILHLNKRLRSSA